MKDMKDIPETIFLQIDDYGKDAESFSELETTFCEDKIYEDDIEYILKLKYEEEHKKNQELIEQQKKIKLISAISGNPDHNRLMKNHINRLVKEIDACIAQLQNSGL